MSSPGRTRKPLPRANIKYQRQTPNEPTMQYIAFNTNKHYTVASGHALI